jgi:hypothetical protein
MKLIATEPFFKRIWPFFPPCEYEGITYRYLLVVVDVASRKIFAKKN